MSHDPEICGCEDCSDRLVEEVKHLRAKLQAADIDLEVVKDLLTTERECNADLRRILGHTPELDPEATYESLHRDYIIVRNNRDAMRSRAEAAEAEVGTLKQSCESWNELVQDLQAEAARLRNDLLAYGHHLESCKMLCIAKTDGWKIAKLHGCSCGFDTAKEK